MNLTDFLATIRYNPPLRSLWAQKPEPSNLAQKCVARAPISCAVFAARKFTRNAGAPEEVAQNRLSKPFAFLR